jgi:hypothetical protein
VKYLFALAFLTLSACSSTPTNVSAAETTDIIQLIEQAKRRFPEVVRGSFKIPIKATGSQQGVVYLNSNLDYRESTNLTIVLNPSTVIALTKMYHSSPDVYLKNKMLDVTGKVERVRIYKYENGKRTKKYYYQTHIRVTSIDQIQVLS